jgi:uncharacterized membrane protein
MGEKLELLLHAPWLMQWHLATVLPATILGAWLLLGKKGDTRHRTLGKLYLGLMLVTALSTIGMPAYVGPPLQLGPVRLFVPRTLHGVWSALATVRRGDIQGHKRAMVGLYVGALLIAGALSFAPGRLMHRMFFG